MAARGRLWNALRGGTPTGSAEGGGHQVLLIGRPGCHLCDDAREVVRQVCDELDVPWSERSVTDDPQLQQQYAEMIPVTLIDGVQHDFFTVDPARLRAALR